jgi:hypothetical protein
MGRGTALVHACAQPGQHEAGVGQVQSEHSEGEGVRTEQVSKKACIGDSELLRMLLMWPVHVSAGQMGYPQTCIVCICNMCPLLLLQWLGAVVP